MFFNYVIMTADESSDGPIWAFATRFVIVEGIEDVPELRDKSGKMGDIVIRFWEHIIICSLFTELSCCGAESQNARCF